jgi:hypothetical protein
MSTTPFFADGVPAVACEPDFDSIDEHLGFVEPDQAQAAPSSRESSAETIAVVLRWFTAPDDRSYVGSGRRNLRLTGQRCFAAAWAINPFVIGADGPNLSKLEKELGVSRQTLSALAKKFTEDFKFVSGQQLGARAVAACRASATDRWERRHASQAKVVLRALQHSGGFTSPWISWARFKAAGGANLWRLVSQAVTWEQRGESKMAIWINSKGLQTFLQKLAATEKAEVER